MAGLAQEEAEEENKVTESCLVLKTMDSMEMKSCKLSSRYCDLGFSVQFLYCCSLCLSLSFCELKWLPILQGHHKV